MCVTEEWSYRECGCRFEYRSSCSREKSNSPPSQSTKDNVITNPGDYADLEPNSFDFFKNEMPFDQQRQCSVNHRMPKQFLEPICDDCLLKELNMSTTFTRNRANRPLCYQDELILESTVEAQTCNNNKYKDDNKLDPKLSSNNMHAEIDNESEAPSSKSGTISSTNDQQVVNHESPFYWSEKVKSQSKPQIRLAIDLTREDQPSPSLSKVDSCTESDSGSDARVLNLFPVVAMYQRLIQTQANQNTWANRILEDLRQTCAKKRQKGPQTRKLRVDNAKGTEPGENITVPSHWRWKSKSATWEEHLRQDLSQRTQRKSYLQIRRRAMKSKSSWISRSQEVANEEQQHQVDTQISHGFAERVLSYASDMISSDTDLPSRSYHEGTVVGESLFSILSETNFDAVEGDENEQVVG